MQYSLHTKTSEVWDLILADINAAKDSVLLNNFTVMDLKEGHIGDRLIKALREALGRGVRVELILDAFGSLEVWRKAKTVLKGMEVRFYNDHLRPKNRLLNVFLRDHRKLAVIDGAITHIGGVVFQQLTAHWTDFNARILDRGVAAEAVRIFEHHQLKLLDRATTRIFKYHFLSHDIDFKRGQIYTAIMKHLKRAKRRVVIQTPYFSIPFLFQQRLKRCLKRGVQVDILLPLTSDSRVADAVARKQADQLKKFGANIYFQPIMNHAKLFLIDDWLTFGSCNADRLSLQYNNELNFQTKNPQLIAETAEFIEAWKSEAILNPVSHQPGLLDRIVHYFAKYVI